MTATEEPIARADLVRRTVELAWAAYRAGSFPVGALAIDRDGTIVAEGRNRIGEHDAPPGRLRAVALAHAEMDVLAQLPVGVDYRAHTLYTSLEPCMLCRAATIMSGIGSVLYVAADPICHGLDRIGELTAHARRNHPEWYGPLDSEEARFSALLAMAVVVQLNGPDHPTVAENASVAPALMAAAASVVGEHRWPARHLDLDTAIAALRPLLDAF